ncbi:MAG: histidine kinase [Desulfovibrio sp.]|nr:histidine kinase [Desulfovibrio sp.]
MTRQTNQPRVLLLSESEALAALERRSLREAGVSQLEMETSGIRAARSLAARAEQGRDKLPDIVVCGQKLSDMDGERFCAIVRLHPLLLALPVLLILPNDGEVEQLRTLGCGASALLARPYAVPTLQQNLQILCSAQPVMARLRQAAQQADIKAFDEALKTYGLLLRPAHQPADYFNVGLQCLEKGRWNNAIEAFRRALRDAQFKGEAELGIASAWKGKGDMSRYQAWLARAAETFVQAKRWRRACSAYVALRKQNPGVKNPFLTEVGRLLRQQHFDAAAQVLARCFEVTPMQQACGKVARTCLKADDPLVMLRSLEASLGREMGKEGTSLSDDIRSCLDTLAREQESYRRQTALERQRQLARQAEGRRQADMEVQASMSSQPAIAAPLSMVATDEETKTDIRSVRTRSSDFKEPVPAAQQEQSLVNNPPLLAPLTKAEATSELFSSRPGLNELLSVIKCTWQLLRRNQQQERRAK